MPTPKYAARIGNIFFLVRIGATLRWATDDIVREDLPEDVLRLLSRLDRLERSLRSSPGQPHAANNENSEA